MKRCYLFMYILLLYNNISLQSIIIQNENDSLDSFILTICLGTPKQCLPFLIRTSLNEIIVFSKKSHHLGYEACKSKTNRSSHMLISKSVDFDNVTGMYMWDTFYIPSINIEIKKIKFILSDNLIKSTKYVGIIGIGSVNSINYNKDSDLIMLLKGNQSIRYSTISFGNSYIYIGNSPFELNESFKYKIKRVCDVNSNYGLFNCEIQNVLLYNGNDVLYKEDNKIVSFSVVEYFVYVTEEFFSFLERDLFYDELKKGDCWEIDGKNYSIVIQCNEKGMESAKNIKLIFFIGRWSEVLNYENLFNEKGELNLRKRIYVDDAWVYGKLILDKYLVTFDKDNNKVIFNTKTPNKSMG